MQTFDNLSSPCVSERTGLITTLSEIQKTGFLVYGHYLNMHAQPSIRGMGGCSLNVDPDQMASKKSADLDLHCFQNRMYPGLSW